jgi:ABC-2 type transport system ATP-binding protein
VNAIEIRNLSKIYSGFTLDNINLTLPSGCIMGLIGENGAGKSTTIKLILNMIKKSGGTITILGKDNQDDIRLTKEDIGVVLDDVGFSDCLTARQVGNMMKHTYKKWDPEAYSAYLRKLTIQENKPFKDFSRGMRMKLGIAVAMSHHAKLLILDEATSGLDPVARDEVVDLFGDFTRDESHAILISSHIVSDLEKICDYIAFLHKGKLILCEEKDALLEKHGIVRCSKNDLTTIDPAAIKGTKETSYGTEVIVLRDAVPSNLSVSPIDIEELFIFMVKENR